MSKNITFSPQYRKIFTVTYTAGSGITSGVSGMPASTQTYRYGAAITVANEEPERSGYAFNGWQLDGDTDLRHKKGETVISAIDENHTLTAVWSRLGAISIEIAAPDTCTASKSSDGKIVTLTMNGAVAINSLTIIDGINLATFNASHNNSVTISGNKLICDTTNWTVGAYQVTMVGGDGILNILTAKATIVVE